MNVISAKPFQSLYAQEPHLALWIDGEPMDQLLNRWVPGHDLEGLIPAWLEWMLDDNDQTVAQKRMLLPHEGCVRVPLLMCPDDLDFSCSIVIADLEVTKFEVRWNRLGYDKTQSCESDAIGTDVQWFDKVIPLRFERSEYEKCIRAFQQENQNAQQGIVPNP